MTVEQPENFEISAEVDGTDFFTTFQAIHRPSGRTVRLTRLARSICESASFRAAFRKDESSLSTLHHPHILPLLFWGEDNGQMFYVTECHVGHSLAQVLEQGRQLTWDEFTDIGWQIASALQHAHNMGMTHGHLTPSSIMVSDSLRTQIVGFGLYRWIAAGQSESEPYEESWAERARNDLMEFGALLSIVMERVHPETTSAADERQVADMIELIERLRRPPLNFTARDVQGRLGNLLLQVSGESIEMIDHRKGQGLSRRSIVDELFDESTGPAQPPSAATAPATDGRMSRRWWIAVIVLAAILAAFLIVTSGKI